MALKIENNDVENLAVGATELDALMLGNDLVWSRLPPEIEIQKQLPINFKSNGRPLTGYRVYGSNTRGVYISQGTLDLPLKLNNIDIPISLNMPLFENEYIDFETQGVYQMGNWINRNFIQGYVQTGDFVIDTNTNWGVTFPKGIPIPSPLSPYSSKSNLVLRSDIQGLQAQMFYLKGEDITRANFTGDVGGWITLPIHLMANDPALTHVTFTFRRNSSWAALSPNELEGHVWIQCENMTSEYHAYSTLVKTSLSLPQITPQNGTNIISYPYASETTPVMMIKGNINALPD